MENLNNFENKIFDNNIENIKEIPKEHLLNFDWVNDEEFEENDFIYEIKILFIGNALSGKSFIITKLIENFDIEDPQIKIKAQIYQRTLGLDKRHHQVILNNEKFFIRYYEIASNIDFKRLYDSYSLFLQSFDLIFFILNKEINYVENLLFLENFKNSIKETNIASENNTKNFFENKFFIINSVLNYSDADKDALTKSIKNNILMMRKDVAKSVISYNSSSNTPDYLTFDIENESITQIKNKSVNNKEISSMSNNKSNNKPSKLENFETRRFIMKQINFNTKNFREFRNNLKEIIFDLFFKNPNTYYKNTSRRSFDHNNINNIANKNLNQNIFKNLTLVEKKNKDEFDLAAKFFFEKQRKKPKKTFHC